MTPYEALVAERYGANQWWTRKPPEHVPATADDPSAADDEVTCRRRLAALVAEMSQHGDPRKEAS